MLTSGSPVRSLADASLYSTRRACSSIAGWSSHQHARGSLIDPLHRIGVLLLLGAWLYQRYRDIVLGTRR
jgi:hypothetical protein